MGSLVLSSVPQHVKAIQAAHIEATGLAAKGMLKAKEAGDHILELERALSVSTAEVLKMTGLDIPTSTFYWYRDAAYKWELVAAHLPQDAKKIEDLTAGEFRKICARAKQESAAAFLGGKQFEQWQPDDSFKGELKQLEEACDLLAETEDKVPVLTIPDDPEAAEKIKPIHGAAKRFWKLVKELRTFVDERKPERKPKTIKLSKAPIDHVSDDDDLTKENLKKAGR